MTKRFARTSLALVAAGLLASPLAASTVSAQTVTSPQINLTAVARGPISSGVTGIIVTVSCQNLFGAVSTSTVAYPVAFGAAALPTYWPLTGVTSVNPGTSCVYKAELNGSANLTAGNPSISITVGGVTRAVTTFTGPLTGNAALTTLAAQTAVLPTFLSTDVVVTVTFPSITVKKVVIGDEPTAGYAYPMTLACSNTVSAAYIGLDGNLYLAAGAGNFLTVNGVKFFDARSVVADVVTAGGVLGTKANIAGALTAVTAAAVAFSAANPGTTVTVAPIGTVSGVVVFNGSFTLTGTGATATRSFGVNELPALTAGSVCEVTEINNQGGVTSFLSTVVNADGTAGTPLPGVQAGTIFKSSLTRVNQMIRSPKYEFVTVIV